MPHELAILCFSILGACLGSFSSLLIWRLHHNESGICAGRSRCPKCQKTLTVKNLIPIISWTIQKGTCDKCKNPIPFFYPLIEIIFAVTFFIFTQKFFGTTHFYPLICSVFFLLILFFYDWWLYEVDDRIAFPAILLAAIWTFFREFNYELFLIGGLIGFSFYVFQYYISKGRWVGAGDMRLGLLMGLLLGWKLLILALFTAYILGLLIAIPLIIFNNYSRKSILPMGAFLIPATLIFLYDGNTIWEWYWNMVI